MTQQIWHSDPLSNSKSNEEEDVSNKNEDGNHFLDLSVWNLDDDDQNENTSDFNIEANTRNEESENVLNSSIWSEQDDEHLLTSLEISENDEQKLN
jgi:hypothetical protein